jgi:hypothetical protein
METFWRDVVVVVVLVGAVVVNVGNGEGRDLQHQRRAGISEVKKMKLGHYCIVGQLSNAFSV